MKGAGRGGSQTIKSGYNKNNPPKTKQKNNTKKPPTCQDMFKMVWRYGQGVMIGQNQDDDKWRCRTCKHLNDINDDICKTCQDPRFKEGQEKEQQYDDEYDQENPLRKKD